jgi:hypothetical protein
MQRKNAFLIKWFTERFLINCTGYMTLSVYYIVKSDVGMVEIVQSQPINDRSICVEELRKTMKDLPIHPVFCRQGNKLENSGTRSGSTNL